MNIEVGKHLVQSICAGSKRADQMQAEVRQIVGLCVASLTEDPIYQGMIALEKYAFCGDVSACGQSAIDYWRIFVHLPPTDLLQRSDCREGCTISYHCGAAGLYGSTIGGRPLGHEVFSSAKQDCLSLERVALVHQNLLFLLAWVLDFCPEAKRRIQRLTELVEQ